MKKGDKKRNQILMFIKNFILVNGYSPTVREIGNGVGLSSSATVQTHLEKLEKQGKIKRELANSQVKPRTIKVLYI